MKKQLLQFGCSLGLLTGLAVLSGCSSTTTVNSVQRAEPIGQREMVKDKRVVTDSGLDKKVRILGVNEVPTADGLLKINVEVRNLQSSLQSFNYRVDWLDQNGMPFEQAGVGWIHREILGKDSLNLTAMSPNPDAKDFRIRFVEDIR